MKPSCKMILIITIVLTFSLFVSANTETSEESDIVSSPEVEDDNKTNYNLNFGFSGALAGASQNSKSSSLSDERPFEEYVSEMDLKVSGRESKRKYWPSCKTKTERFCEKACRKSYRDVCKSYNCRKSVRKAFKSACKHHCKSKFSYYVYIHERQKP